MIENLSSYWILALNDKNKKFFIRECGSYGDCQYNSIIYALYKPSTMEQQKKLVKELREQISMSLVEKDWNQWKERSNKFSNILELREYIQTMGHWGDDFTAMQIQKILKIHLIIMNAKNVNFICLTDEIKYDRYVILWYEPEYHYRLVGYHNEEEENKTDIFMFSKETIPYKLMELWNAQCIQKQRLDHYILDYSKLYEDHDEKKIISIKRKIPEMIRKKNQTFDEFMAYVAMFTKKTIDIEYIFNNLKEGEIIAYREEYAKENKLPSIVRITPLEDEEDIWNIYNATLKKHIVTTTLKVFQQLKQKNVILHIVDEYSIKETKSNNKNTKIKINEKKYYPLLNEESFFKNLEIIIKKYKTLIFVK